MGTSLELRLGHLTITLGAFAGTTVDWLNALLDHSSF